MIGSCLFLPRSLGRWSNLTKATAVFNCIETTYINAWIIGIPLKHLPFQFRQPIASEQSFKRIYTFSFASFVDFNGVPLVWLVFADLFAQRALKKHRVSWDCGETTQESPLLRFGELRGLLRTMTGTLSTLDISNLGSSDERIAARRTRAEAKLKQDKERGLWICFLLLLHGNWFLKNVTFSSGLFVFDYLGPLECSDW